MGVGQRQRETCTGASDPSFGSERKGAGAVMTSGVKCSLHSLALLMSKQNHNKVEGEKSQ